MHCLPDWCTVGRLAIFSRKLPRLCQLKASSIGANPADFWCSCLCRPVPCWSYCTISTYDWGNTQQMLLLSVCRTSTGVYTLRWPSDTYDTHYLTASLSVKPTSTAVSPCIALVKRCLGLEGQWVALRCARHPWASVQLLPSVLYQWPMQPIRHLYPTVLTAASRSDLMKAPCSTKSTRKNNTATEHQ